MTALDSGRTDLAGTRLTELARRLRASGRDVKWAQLSAVIQDEVLSDAGRPQKLIVFTEHRDTLEYLRRRIGVVDKQMEVYLTNGLLRGEVDEVLTLQDGTMAPLDYKFAKWEERLYDTYRTQLLCYAWLIEENFGKAVTRRYLVYTRSKNHLLEVPIRPADVAEVQAAAAAIQAIIQKNMFPPATKMRKRCDHCTYRNVCPQ